MAVHAVLGEPLPRMEVFLAMDSDGNGMLTRPRASARGAPEDQNEGTFVFFLFCRHLCLVCLICLCFVLFGF